MSQRVGLGFQAPSMPLVVVCTPLPLPRRLRQPRPLLLEGRPFGLGPTSAGSPAPWALPKVWPPAVSATVSSSFMAMRAKVSRTSRPEATGSGLPFGPSGFT
jgi:hypothetical protein